MTEMGRLASGTESGSVSNAATAGMPHESDLPSEQGLNSGLPHADVQPDDPEDTPSSADAADRASDAGSVTGTGIAGSAASSSDPMPDMAGTGGSGPTAGRTPPL